MQNIADILLFLSSLILLINVAPIDFYPKYRKLKESIKILKQEKNILSSSSGVNIQGATIFINDEFYKILSDLIKRKSPLNSDVDWDKSIGIGYSEIVMPVLNNKIIAYRPLYIIQPPTENPRILQLVPVGNFDDLYKWMSEPREKSLNFFALFLLTLGFFLQIFLR